MTVRHLFSSLLLVAVLVLAGGNSAAAQLSVTVAATGPDLLGFSYGWNGGISVEPGGAVRMREHPRIKAVRRSTGAAAAGLMPGDVIMSVDGRDARDPTVLRNVQPGRRLAMVIRREGAERRVVLTTATPGRKP